MLDSGVAVCVVDSGIWTAHPDLKANTFSGCDTQCQNPKDTHGTHVTGTLAAIGNDFGVVGAIGGAPSAVVGFAGLPNEGGTGTTSQCMEAIQACVDHLDALKQDVSEGRGSRRRPATSAFR
jgi:subtilisin family serine protease